MAKLNCWEVMKCGREVGGKNVKELGVCPAALENRANKIHGGKNAGRCCWAVVGTFCGGKVQGAFVDKFEDCSKCPFYKLVTEEEKEFLFAGQVKKIIEEKNNSENKGDVSI